jgi:hypothetical protein
MPFPNSMQMTQAPAVEGDLASLNPRRVLPGAAGSWVAGAGGVTVGRFAWGDVAATDSVLINSAASGAPSCIVAREFGDPMITTYLAEGGMTIPQGMPVGLPLIEADVWVKATIATAAVGQKAFAKLADGTVQFANTGATVTGYVETKWYAATIGTINGLVKITSTSID